MMRATLASFKNLYIKVRDVISAKVTDAIVLFSGKTWLLIAIAIILLPFLAWKVTGWVVYYRLGNDVSWSASNEFLPEGGSKTVGVLAALLDREVVNHTWTPSKPIWHPAASLDDPQNFQLGVKQAVERIALALSDYIGRDRSSSAFNSDLADARGKLNYAADRWIMSTDSSTLITESSESMFRKAIERLQKYNRDLADPKINVWYSVRSDNLRDTLGLISSDLGSASVMLQNHANNGYGGWFDQNADDVFLQTQGKLYVYYMVLKAMGDDFAEVIKTKQVGESWAKMMDYLKDAVDVDPTIVFNGDEESLLIPNHLNNQNSRLQLAARALNEIRDILDR